MTQLRRIARSISNKIQYKKKNNKSATTNGTDGRSDTLHHPRGREIHGDIY